MFRAPVARESPLPRGFVGLEDQKTRHSEDLHKLLLPKRKDDLLRVIYSRMKQRLVRCQVRVDGIGEVVGEVLLKADAFIILHSSGDVLLHGGNDGGV